MLMTPVYEPIPTLESSKILTNNGDVMNWATLFGLIAGTTNQITVADDGDGTITLATPQDIHTGATPTFAALNLGTGEITCGSINRAANTLTLEIGGTAEVSITSTAVTLGGDLVLTTNPSVISSANVIQIKPFGDADDYLEFSVEGNVPTITTVGGASLYLDGGGTTCIMRLRGGAGDYGELQFSVPNDDFQIYSTGNMTLYPGPGATDYLEIKTNGDTDDYFRFSTVGGVPTIGTVGGCDLKITADSGEINFDNENLTTSGLGTFGDLLVKDSGGGVSRPLSWFPTDASNNYLEIGGAIRIGRVAGGTQVVAIDGVNDNFIIDAAGTGRFNLNRYSGTGGVRIHDGLGVGDTYLELNPGSITDTSGTISFGNENLTNSGNITSSGIIESTAEYGLQVDTRGLAKSANLQIVAADTFSASFWLVADNADNDADNMLIRGNVSGHLEFLTKGPGAYTVGLYMDPFADITIPQTLTVGERIASGTATITASSDTTDVSGINTLFINITGDIVLGGLVGGVDGQVIYIVAIGNFVNHFRLEHAEGIGGNTQDFINHTAADEDISHGGCAYLCNGTNWYDISHARHV